MCYYDTRGSECSNWMTDSTMCCHAGFSLNGELMMDRMGQEIAFKGIDLTSLYVPAFSLSSGQHARVNFGQVSRRFLASVMTIIFTRDSIYAIARICYGNSVCPSVCPSVTRVDQSKTVKARITQFSPYSSPIRLVFRG